MSTKATRTLPIENAPIIAGMIGGVSVKTYGRHFDWDLNGNLILNEGLGKTPRFG